MLRNRDFLLAANKQYKKSLKLIITSKDRCFKEILVSSLGFWNNPSFSKSLEAAEWLACEVELAA